MRLLYVEDHAAFRAAVITQFLSAHEIIVAANLEEARTLLANSQFDAVLLDYDLPDGKGTVLLDALSRRGLSLKVIAVSSMDEKNALLLAAGACAAVSKMKFSRIVEVQKTVEQELKL